MLLTLGIVLVATAITIALILLIWRSDLATQFKIGFTFCLLLLVVGGGLIAFGLRGSGAVVEETPLATETPVLPATPVISPVSPTPITPLTIEPTMAETPPALSPTSVKTTPPPGLPEFSCLVSSYGSYFPALQIDEQGLDVANGFDLRVIPLDLPEGQTAYGEAELVEKVRSGEWDCVLNTLDSFGRHGNYGVITAIIDESAGADQVWARPGIETLNDLEGQRIAFFGDSVSEFMVLALLNLVGLGPQDVTLLPQESPSDAVALFNNGDADVVSAWEPDVLDAELSGGHLLIGSDTVRYISDVIVVSDEAVAQKPEVVQAFHRVWFQALKQQFEELPEAAASIARWTSPEWESAYNDWTYVYPDTAEDDMRLWLEHIAQAGLSPNRLVMQNPTVIEERLRLVRQIWAQTDAALPPLDEKAAVDPRFVLALDPDDSILRTDGKPVNTTFIMGGLPEFPEIPSELAVNVGQLPLFRFEFIPDTTQLTPEAQQALNESALPILRASMFYLKITGSSAWPSGYSEAEIRNFALQRATSIQDYLVSQGIDPNRLIVDAIVPPVSAGEVRAEDRFVRFELLRAER